MTDIVSNWTEQREIFGCSVRSAPRLVLGNVERGTLEVSVHRHRLELLIREGKPSGNNHSSPLAIRIHRTTENCFQLSGAIRGVKLALNSPPDE